MYVRVLGRDNDACIEVCDPDDCTRLHVEADSQLTTTELDQALYAAGLTGERSAEGDTVWLDASKLFAVGTVAEVGSDWPDRFNAMLAYATSKGWCDPARQHVAAHVEWRE
jgi:hypothetical protein